MKALLVTLSLVLIVVLIPVGVFAWSPSEDDPQVSLNSHTIQYPASWVNDDPVPFLLKVSAPAGFPYLVGDFSTKLKFSSFLSLALKMGATEARVLNNIGFVTLPSGLRVKEGKIYFVHLGSTYYAAVLTSDERNMYLSCMVVFPWNAYDGAFAQDIFNTIYKKVPSGKK